MKRSIIALTWVLASVASPALVSAAPAPAAAKPMDVTFMPISHEDKDADARLDALKALGVTSIQTYIYWNKVEKTPGVRDWADYDADVALFRKHGLKWVPFVIVGPWYVTPEFVRQDPRIVKFRCLEHGRESAMPSIWCERTREYVRTWLQAFAEHYRPMGVIESVDLGITGDYGEAIYSVIGNWPGAYHSHVGYWCGDALAVADFQRAMRELYPGGVAALNQAWRAHYASFDEVKPFLPLQAPSERAWQEFLQWYRGAMTSYADFCLKTAREAFPDSDLYLCTGGDMAPEHGSDFSAQAQAAARYGAGVRITNESSSFPMNFRLTRMVDSPARFYGAYVGHEPAATVTPTGMLGRIFNAVTSGARQFFFYDTPEVLVAKEGRYVPGESGTYLQRYHDWLKVAHPRVETAVYYPNPYTRETKCDRQDFSDLAAQIRRFIDYDFVDDRLIQDGALRDKTILIVAGAEVMDAATASRIEQWARAGGIVFVLDRRSTDWDGKTAAFDRLAGFTSQSDEAQGISEVVVVRPQALPSIAGLADVTCMRGYTGLQADCEPLLVTRYDPKVGVAWRRKIGSGVVFAYYGPMDLKAYEQDWAVAHKLPLRFIRDCLAAEVAAGTIKQAPPTLNLTAEDVYQVQTDSGLWILNVAGESRRIEEGGATVEVPARSIVRR